MRESDWGEWPEPNENQPSVKILAEATQIMADMNVPSKVSLAIKNFSKSYQLEILPFGAAYPDYEISKLKDKLGEIEGVASVVVGSD